MTKIPDKITFYVYPGDVYELDIQEEVVKRHPGATGYRITATDVMFDTEDGNHWRVQAVLNLCWKGGSSKTRFNDSSLPSDTRKSFFVRIRPIDPLATTATARLRLTRDNDDMAGKTLYVAIRLCLSVVTPTV